MMTGVEPNLLRQFLLFQDLTEGELKQVASIAHFRHFPKLHTFFLEGEQGNYVVLILSGVVRISRSAADGRVKTLALLREPDFFGEMAIFLKGHQRSATAEALTDCRVITLDREGFEKLLREYSGISLRIIQTLAQRLQAMNQHVKTLALGDSQAKLADLLLWIKDGFEHSKDAVPVIPLTHQDLADLAGLSRETITRILNGLEAEGVVKLKPRHVELVNLDKLKKFTA